MPIREKKLLGKSADYILGFLMGYDEGIMTGMNIMADMLEEGMGGHEHVHPGQDSDAKPDYLR